MGRFLSAAPLSRDLHVYESQGQTRGDRVLLMDKLFEPITGLPNGFMTPRVGQ